LVDGPGGNCDEIWAAGLRNPWRSSFDRLTGDLYIGDVGQNTWEEVNFKRAGSPGGTNYGWRCYEGNHPYNLDDCKNANSYVFPIFEYSRGTNPCASVIAGYVYRGSNYPAMYGHFFLTDYCSGIFWDLVCEASGWKVTQHTNLQDFGRVAFGEDAQGELYVIDMDDNEIYQLVENTVVPATPTPKTIFYLPLVFGSSSLCS
jgi:glucose/arabinose dehydrogenase